MRGSWFFQDGGPTRPGRVTCAWSNSTRRHEIYIHICVYVIMHIYIAMLDNAVFLTSQTNHYCDISGSTKQMQGFTAFYKTNHCLYLWCPITSWPLSKSPEPHGPLTGSGKICDKRIGESVHLTVFVMQSLVHNETAFYTYLCILCWVYVL